MYDSTRAIYCVLYLKKYHSFYLIICMIKVNLKKHSSHPDVLSVSLVGQPLDLPLYTHVSMPLLMTLFLPKYSQNESYSQSSVVDLKVQHLDRSGVFPFIFLPS